jgi:CheY-like chemotaxis protein
MARVMIVEDEKELHEAYKTILNKEKHQVISAYNGQEALEILHDNDVDLILLDMRMPIMNGIEFLENITQKTTAKIIVFSNIDTQKDIDEAYRLGADRYILKAWASPQELVKVIRDYV